jgi:crotonobetainyl-CoA:carnitine CoA-transferase CaiB-like acyl-CoA transferase
MSALGHLLAVAGLDPALAGSADLSGAEPALPSSFALGTASQASIAAVALAAARLHAERGGAMQRVAIAMRHAAIEFRSERHLTLDGQPPPDPWDALAGAYPCGDGRMVRLHTNFPRHREAVLRLLGCAAERPSVAAALAAREAFAFEAELAAAGGCAAALRSFAEWDAHPQAAALYAQPVLRLERIGDAPPKPLPAVADRPLAGLRVLDLTRVIAGPVAGRALAAHGAEVLHITSPALHFVPTLVMDTGRGKRPASLDLGDARDAATLRRLIAGADAWVQSYRPGALDGLGFGAETLAAQHPGLVLAELSAYGWDGPWAGRRGFDSLAQAATGFNIAEAEAAGTAPPRVLPCQPLDHASGYLLALGILAAWLRRAREGGSWRVRVTLAGTGLWLRSLGRVEHGFAAPEPDAAEVAPLLETRDTAFGRLATVRHAARMERTPAHWALPAAPLGSAPASWDQPFR